mgnify:CR=1 FL=1
MNCLQQQNNKMKESIRASIGSYRFFYVHPENRSIISCVWSGNDTLVGVCLTCLKPGLKAVGKVR